MPEIRTLHGIIWILNRYAAKSFNVVVKILLLCVVARDKIAVEAVNSILGLSSVLTEAQYVH